MGGWQSTRMGGTWGGPAEPPPPHPGLVSPVRALSTPSTHTHYTHTHTTYTHTHTTHTHTHTNHHTHTLPTLTPTLPPHTPTPTTHTHTLHTHTHHPLTHPHYPHTHTNYTHTHTTHTHHTHTHPLHPLPLSSLTTYAATHRNLGTTTTPRPAGMQSEAQGQGKRRNNREGRGGWDRCAARAAVATPQWTVRVGAAWLGSREGQRRMQRINAGPGKAEPPMHTVDPSDGPCSHRITPRPRGSLTTGTDRRDRKGRGAVSSMSYLFLYHFGRNYTPPTLIRWLLTVSGDGREWTIGRNNSVAHFRRRRLGRRRRFRCRRCCW